MMKFQYGISVCLAASLLNHPVSYYLQLFFFTQSVNTAMQGLSHSRVEPEHEPIHATSSRMHISEQVGTDAIAGPYNSTTRVTITAKILEFMISLQMTVPM